MHALPINADGVLLLARDQVEPDHDVLFVCDHCDVPIALLVVLGFLDCLDDRHREETLS